MRVRNCKQKKQNDVEEDDDEALQTRVVRNKCQTGGHLARESDEFQNGVRVFTLIERVYLFTQTHLGIRPMVFKILCF